MVSGGQPWLLTKNMLTCLHKTGRPFFTPMHMYTVRKATEIDHASIFALYLAVGAAPIGIARSPEEITGDYISHFMQLAATRGIELVIENPAVPGEIVAEIHCYQPAPKILHHIMSDLTIAVRPDFQGRGLGKMIFSHLLAVINNTRPDIVRVELLTQESNERAIALYTQLGFVIEGRFERRVKARHGRLEADIPMAWFSKHLYKL
jgi:ribosomal protein S18 acetylase RimI-like enzyme